MAKPEVIYKCTSIDSNILKKEAHITSLVKLDVNTVAFSSINNIKPITCTDITFDEKTKKSKIGKKLVNLDCEKIKDAAFINKINDNNLIVIDNNELNLYSIKQNKIDGQIMPDNKKILLDNLIDIILASCNDNNQCANKNCYTIDGFVELSGFNIIVQHSCSHKTDNNKYLFIMKSKLNNLVITDTKLYRAIDLCILFSCSYIKADNYDNTRIKSFTVNKSNKTNKLYIMASSGSDGIIWTIPYYKILDMLGMPEYINTVKYSPTCILYNDTTNNLLVLCKSDKQLIYTEI